MSGAKTNFGFHISNTTGPLDIIMHSHSAILTINGTYCSCLTDSNCKQPATIYQYHPEIPSFTLLYTIPGFYSGCYYIESLILSTTTCLFSSDCIDLIEKSINVTGFTPLVYSNQSRFSIDATFGSIIDELFIESWSHIFNYSTYVEQCQPASCTYIVTRQPSLDFVITFVTGLLGGVSILLRLVVPWIIALFFYKCRQNEDEAETSSVVEARGEYIYYIY
jgi:hypothetical protein